jgi:intracellular multiplication protein IcmN
VLRIFQAFCFRTATWLAASILLLLLSGCHKQYYNSTEIPKLPYKVSGAKDRVIIDKQAAFNKRGIRVISLGQDYMISIPSAAIFPDESPQLRWDSYSLLNAMACYLKEFRKVAINITAYSNKCGSEKRDRALTLARARAVGDYLWSQGIDSRFIFTEGLGSDKPIMFYSKKGDRSLNSRIEISFRDAVA